MIEMEPWQWILGWLGALLIGLGKGGIPGMGNLTIALYAIAFPARESIGIMLIVLFCTDLVAITIYRGHVHWPSLLKLLPWSLVGILIGYFSLGNIDNDGVRRLIGIILLGMSGLHFFRRWQMARFLKENRQDSMPNSVCYVALLGLAGGFATMTANGAGPVAALYLLAIGLPKMAFIGTSAWFFILMNICKVPLQIDLGIITNETVRLSLVFAPVAAVGAVFGRFAISYINQKFFEIAIWFIIVLVGFELFFNFSAAFK